MLPGRAWLLLSKTGRPFSASLCMCSVLTFAVKSMSYSFIKMAQMTVAPLQIKEFLKSPVPIPYKCQTTRRDIWYVCCFYSFALSLSRYSEYSRSFDERIILSPSPRAPLLSKCASRRSALVPFDFSSFSDDIPKSVSIRATTAT